MPDDFLHLLPILLVLPLIGHFNIFIAKAVETGCFIW